MSNIYSSGPNATIYTVGMRRNYHRGHVTDFSRVEGLPGDATTPIAVDFPRPPCPLLPPNVADFLTVAADNCPSLRRGLTLGMLRWLVFRTCHSGVFGATVLKYGEFVIACLVGWNLWYQSSSVGSLTFACGRVSLLMRSCVHGSGCLHLQGCISRISWMARYSTTRR